MEHSALNIIDRAVSFFSPRKGAERLRDRNEIRKMAASGLTSFPAFGGGYAGGMRSTLREHQAGHRSLNQTEDTLTGDAYHRLQLNCMDIFRNSPMCRAVVDGINRYLGETVPRASTGDEAFDTESTQYFTEYWWNIADARRRGTFHKLEEFVTTCGWLMGDMVNQITPDGLMPIEGIRLATPSELRRDDAIVKGIRIGKSGSDKNKITHFYVCSRRKHGGLDLKNYQRVRHSNAFYSHNSWRPDQVRGTPKLHGVVDLLIDHDDTHTNVVNNIKFASQIFSIERDGARKKVQPRMVTDSEGVKTTYEQTPIGMAIRTTGKPDEDFILPEMKNPNPQFVETMEYEAGLVSAGTGYPFSMLMNKFSQASYMPHRAERVALEILLYNEWRYRVQGLCQQAWNWAIARAVKRKEIAPAPTRKLRNGLEISQWFRAEWSLPYVPEIDQGKEEKARTESWLNCNATISEWARARKTTLKAVLDERDVEIKDMQKRAKNLGLTVEQYAPRLFPWKKDTSQEKPNG